MRKGIKILGKVVSTILLLLIFLPVAITLVLNIEPVQNAVVRQASSYTSNLLGTDVYVEGIDFDLFSKIRIRGLYIEDYNKDTLLYIPHVSTSIEGLNIVKEGIKLSGTKMYGTKLYLRELPSGELNIHPLLAQLQNPEKSNDFRLYIDDIDAEELTVRYEKLEHGDTKHGIDFSNIRLNDINTHLTSFAVVRGTIWTDIEHLSFNERSGFAINELTSHLYIDQGKIALDGLNILTNNSSIYLPKLELSGDDWESYKRFASNVSVDGRVEHSKISSDDIAYIKPSLRNLGLTINSFSATIEGTLDNIEGSIKRAKVAKNTSLEATYRIKGLPYLRDAQYVVGIENLHSTADDVLAIANRIVPDSLPEDVTAIIERIQWIDLRSTVGGKLNDLRFVGNINTGAGEASGDLTFTTQEDERLAIAGVLKSTGLNIGEILSLEKLRSVSSEITLNGSIGKAQSGGIIGDVGVKIASIEYSGHTFRDIEGECRVSGNDYYGEINSLDPNITFDLRADLKLSDTKPTYIASMALKRADLNALGINRRDSISVISANIGIDLQGVLSDGFDGYVSIADVTYDYPQGTLTTDRAKVDFENLAEYKSILLNSDFLTLNYYSNSSYIEAYNHLYTALKRYLPIIYDKTGESDIMHECSNGINDYTALSIKAGESVNDLLDAIVKDVDISPKTSFDLRYNPHSNGIAVRGESEAMEYSGVILEELFCDLNNYNNRDSLVLNIGAENLYVGTRPLMPNIRIKGGICNNTVDLSTAFNEGAEEGNSALLALKANVRYNSKKTHRMIHIDVLPSYFNNSSELWQLYSRGIDITPSKVTINNFHIARPDQQLVVDGVISNSLKESLRLTFDNFNISGLSMLLKRIGYSIDGISNGYVVVKSALQNPEFEASMSMNNIKINGVAVAPQYITSEWDTKNNSAHIIVRDRRLQERVIEGYYTPTTKKYHATAKVRNTDMALLYPFLKGVLSDIEGKADINVDIEGEGKKAVLSGKIAATNFGGTINYTKARYTAPTAKFTINNNIIEASRIPIYDVDRNMGYLSINTDLNNIRNVSYEINANVDKMLVLNTTTEDNDTFYGHVYATGEASFKGNKRGTKMNIDVTSADNSKFYLPLQRKEDVAHASFIKFVEPNIEKIDTIDYLTRLMMAYERRNREENRTSKVMDIDININVQPNIEMQLVIDPTMGDIIKGKGSGELALHIVPEADIFEMQGDITISEGTYFFTLLSPINKLFTVVPGSSLRWDGDPKATILDIDAVYSTKASLRPLIGSSLQGFDTSHSVPVDCYIKLTDELKSPTVTFDVKVPNVAPEIQTIVQSALNDQHAIATQMFWLLTANSFSADDIGGISGASLSATTGFELLSNQLSNWLSGEDYNIILRYRPRTDIAGDEIDVGFSRSLFDNRVLVELEGGYLSDASVQAMQKASNFVGEAFITWLIDPEGTFKLRGFTQTIDRYGENQGMQESGVGVYYNESFNTFGELKQSLKKRFGNKDDLISPFVNVNKRTRKEDSPNVTIDNIRARRALEKKSETETKEINNK